MILLFWCQLYFQFVAIAARDVNRAQAFADKLGFKKAYGSYDELMKDPNVGKSMDRSFVVNINLVSHNVVKMNGLAQ